MENKEKFLKWLGDTLSLKYVKSLINEKEDANLKDAMAAFFCVVGAIICFYTAYKGTDSVRVQIIFYIFGFIALLMGIKEGGKAINKKDDGVDKE